MAKRGDLRKFYETVVIRYTGSDCLIWPYTRNSRGYGTMRHHGVPALVHRMACEETQGGPPSPDCHASHICGDRLCVNPNHIRWATPKENNADKLLHGTHHRGERCPTSKLTDAQAKEIFSLKGEEPQRVTAKRFGVTRQTVSDIHRGHRWAWLSTEVAK